MYGTIIFLPIFSEKITDIIFINCVYVNSTMLLDVAHLMHQFYKIKEKCNDQSSLKSYTRWNEKLRKNKRHVHAALVCPFCHSKSIERERRKANTIVTENRPVTVLVEEVFRDWLHCVRTEEVAVCSCSGSTCSLCVVCSSVNPVNPLVLL